MPLPLESRLDPKNDLVFKLLFSDEELLVALLSAVLEPPVPIRRVKLLNPELPVSAMDDKARAFGFPEATASTPCTRCESARADASSRMR